MVVKIVKGKNDVGDNKNNKLKPVSLFVYLESKSKVKRLKCGEYKPSPVRWKHIDKLYNINNNNIIIITINKFNTNKNKQILSIIIIIDDSNKSISRNNFDIGYHQIQNRNIENVGIKKDYSFIIHNDSNHYFKNNIIKLSENRFEYFSDDFLWKRNTKYLFSETSLLSSPRSIFSSSGSLNYRSKDSLLSTKFIEHLQEKDDKCDKSTGGISEASETIESRLLFVPNSYCNIKPPHEYSLNLSNDEARNSSSIMRNANYFTSSWSYTPNKCKSTAVTCKSQKCKSMRNCPSTLSWKANSITNLSGVFNLILVLLAVLPSGVLPFDLSKYIYP